MSHSAVFDALRRLALRSRLRAGVVLRAMLAFDLTSPDH